MRDPGIQQVILSGSDWLAIGLYFILIIGVGYYFSRKKKSVDQYFMAGRKSRWYAIGPSIFAANISSEHIIGLAGAGAASGLAVGAYEWMAAFCLFTLAWLFLPFYLKSQVYTMPEFLEKRFSSASRFYLSSISILAYIFTKISVALFAGSILLEYILGWDYVSSSIVLVVFAGIYTLMGGLAAVIFADMIQTLIIVLGSAILVLLGLNRVGGFSGLRQQLDASFFDMIHPASHEAFPWPGVTFGIFILGIWYWCTDQFIVQKSLSARGLDEARAGVNFTAALKILPVFIFVLPGLIARVLWPEQIELRPDLAYPKMVTALIPSGMIGLMIAALMAALISSLSAVFTSCSTLITFDFYKRFAGADVSDTKLVNFGRFTTIGIIILGILWIPVIRHMSNQLYMYLQAVQAYISPPITAVFLAGVLWKRATDKAAIITLIAGFLFGAGRFLLDILNKTGDYRVGIIEAYATMPFLHFCILSFLFCLLVLVITSILTVQKTSPALADLTISKKAFSQEGKPIWTYLNIAMSLIVALSIISMWAHFN